MKLWRLRKNFEFQRVYKAGGSKAAHNIAMYVMPNGLTVNRLGVSVSKKVGGSVVRSRVKRLVIESYLRAEERTHKGYDILVVARARAASSDFDAIRRSYDYLLYQHNVLPKKEQA